jgi:hypothetical protein
MQIGATELVKAAIPVAKGVHEILKERPVYEKVIDFFTRKPEQHILLLGASGVGKSSFLKSIQGEYAYIPREHRTETSAAVDGRIDTLNITFIDTPGEAQHTDRRKKTIRESVHTKSLGIINVVSYGFHEGTAKVSEAVDNNQAKDDFLERRREVELERLTEWIPILCGQGGHAAWIITVVTKADLWWQNTPDQPVIAYYREGKYFKSLGEATKEQTCSVRPYASLNQMFYGQGKMSGFYPDPLRQTHYNDLIALILASSDNGPMIYTVVNVALFFSFVALFILMWS